MVSSNLSPEGYAFAAPPGRTSTTTPPCWYTNKHHTKTKLIKKKCNSKGTNVHVIAAINSYYWFTTQGFTFRLFAEFSLSCLYHWLLEKYLSVKYLIYAPPVKTFPRDLLISPQAKENYLCHQTLSFFEKLSPSGKRWDKTMATASATTKLYPKMITQPKYPFLLSFKIIVTRFSLLMPVCYSTEKT